MKKVDYCKIYSPVPNNSGKGLLNKRWGYLTDNLSINKWGVQIKVGVGWGGVGGSEKSSRPNVASYYIEQN